MHRKHFLADPDVQGFIDWLATSAGEGEFDDPAPNKGMKVNLNVRHSAKVPGGINASVQGLPAVLGLYKWNAKWLDPITQHATSSGDWSSTRNSLSALSAFLRGSIEEGNQQSVLAACRAVLAWGGNRNYGEGAYPFLVRLCDTNKLIQYLHDCQSAFMLDNANTEALCPPILLMNSMLTKVHALLATDGLPIYDSRVAAAISTLIEMYRSSIGENVGFKFLNFPATDRNRMVGVRFPMAQSSGLMPQGQQNASSRAVLWASAKVRLGWIIEQVLTQATNLFSSHAMPERMHAFEASLFMIGYNVRCLEDNS